MKENYIENFERGMIEILLHFFLFTPSLTKIFWRYIFSWGYFYIAGGGGLFHMHSNFMMKKGGGEWDNEKLKQNKSNKKKNFGLQLAVHRY